MTLVEAGVQRQQVMALMPEEMRDTAASMARFSNGTGSYGLFGE